MSKMRYIEKKFKEAEDYLQNTGEGLTTADDKMGIIVIRDKVLSICPFYYQVKPYMSESAAVNPPYLGETGTNESVEDMLFGDNTARGLDNSLPDDTEDLNSEDENSSSEEEPDDEADISAQQEPIPETASQGPLPVPKIAPSRISSNTKPKEKKKKPKSFKIPFKMWRSKTACSWKRNWTCTCRVNVKGCCVKIRRSSSKERNQIRNSLLRPDASI